MNAVVIGLAAAFWILPAQLILARVLEFVPGGTRAQATGACVASLTIMLTGLAMGLLIQRRDAIRAVRSAAEAIDPSRGILHAQRQLIGMLIDEGAESIPWLAILVAAVVLCAAGAIGLYTDLPALVLPESTMVTGGIARTIFATDAIVLPVLIQLLIGTLVGLNARPWTMLTSLLGCAVLAGLIGGGVSLAQYASYDQTIVLALEITAVIVAGLATGFLVSWARRRLAFVEQFMIAHLAGYAIYLAAAIGPKSLIASYNVPEEQILLALVLAPNVALLVLLTVGGSIGFILLGGGKFDAGFKFEAGIALRHLRGLRTELGAGQILILFFFGPIVGPLILELAGKKTVAAAVVAVISILGVAMGVTALIVVLSVMSGFEDDLKQKILGAHAHVVLGKHGDDFEEYKETEDRVRGVEGIASAAAFVLGDAMVSSDVGLSGTLVKGIDPANKEATKDLRKNMEKGSLDHLMTPEMIPGARPKVTFRSSTSTGSNTATTGLAEAAELLEPAAREPEGGKVLPGIIIGKELSKTLRAYVGDTVKVVSPVSEEIGPTGPHPKLRRFRVAGIFYSGMYEYDAKFTYVEMKQAQTFFGKRGKVTGVEVRVEDVDDTARIVEELKRLMGGYPYTCKDWREMNKELFSALLLEKLAMFIILTFIILVASFNIVATLIMIVLEKRREIAIMKSLGASDSSIMKIFVVQGLIVGVGGALLGLALGIGLCSFIEKFGIPLDQKVFYIERLPVVVSWGEIAVIAVAAVVISYLATIYPAITAAKLRPVEGLRDD